jgi:hypothetical protein
MQMRSKGVDRTQTSRKIIFHAVPEVTDQRVARPEISHPGGIFFLLTISTAAGELTDERK